MFWFNFIEDFRWQGKGRPIDEGIHRRCWHNLRRSLTPQTLWMELNQRIMQAFFLVNAICYLANMHIMQNIFKDKLQPSWCEGQRSCFSQDSKIRNQGKGIGEKETKIGNLGSGIQEFIQPRIRVRPSLSSRIKGSQITDLRVLALRFMKIGLPKLIKQ